MSAFTRTRSTGQHNLVTEPKKTGRPQPPRLSALEGQPNYRLLPKPMPNSTPKLIGAPNCECVHNVATDCEAMR